MAAIMHATAYQTYGERSEDPNLTPLATYLLRLMHLKQTNLCVSADVTTTNELLSLAEEVGDSICILKTHADIISDFNEKTIRGLNELSRRKKFIVFEDRKFGDIGSKYTSRMIDTLANHALLTTAIPQTPCSSNTPPAHLTSCAGRPSSTHTSFLARPSSPR